MITSKLIRIVGGIATVVAAVFTLILYIFDKKTIGGRLIQLPRSACNSSRW